MFVCHLLRNFIHRLSRKSHSAFAVHISNESQTVKSFTIHELPTMVHRVKLELNAEVVHCMQLERDALLERCSQLVQWLVCRLVSNGNQYGIDVKRRLVHVGWGSTHDIQVRDQRPMVVHRTNVFHLGQQQRWQRGQTTPTLNKQIEDIFVDFVLLNFQFRYTTNKKGTKFLWMNLPT